MEEWAVGECWYDTGGWCKCALGCGRDTVWRWGALVIGIGSDTEFRCGVFGVGTGPDADADADADVEPHDLWLCEEEEEPIR